LALAAIAGVFNSVGYMAGTLAAGKTPNIGDASIAFGAGAVAGFAMGIPGCGGKFGVMAISSMANIGQYFDINAHNGKANNAIGVAAALGTGIAGGWISEPVQNIVNPAISPLARSFSPALHSSNTVSWSAATNNLASGFGRGILAGLATNLDMDASAGVPGGQSPSGPGPGGP
jgi:hypothetical protein